MMIDVCGRFCLDGSSLPQPAAPFDWLDIFPVAPATNAPAITVMAFSSPRPVGYSRQVPAGPVILRRRGPTGSPNSLRPSGASACSIPELMTHTSRMFGEADDEWVDLGTASATSIRGIKDMRDFVVVDGYASSFTTSRCWLDDSKSQSDFSEVSFGSVNNEACPESAPTSDVPHNSPPPLQTVQEGAVRDCKLPLTLRLSALGHPSSV